MFLASWFQYFDHQSFLQSDTIIIYWYSWSSILKLLKVKRLHYLYNITKKKEVRSWVHFLHADKHQSFYKLTLSFLWKWPDMSKVPKGSWQYFCNLLRRKCRNCFCVLLRCKTFTYFTGIQPCSLLLVSQCY